jgi:squalene-hopene/tetraprenyl-beta-curcumene cyclase
MASEIKTRLETRAALELACEHLLSRQQQGGFWRGELQTNVTMDAEDLLLREFLGISEADKTERAAAWIRSQQRADGTWANFHGGPAELSTTIEAYWALRLAGDAQDAPHMLEAAAYIRASGGLERARVFTHLWLALFDLWSWDRVPALPPEVVLLPRWVPLNIYDFACWARQTIVALALVKAQRPVHTLPFGLDELRAGAGDDDASPAWSSDPLALLDRVLRAYERRPFGPLRRFAIARAERWVLARQEADGSWGGIQPPWVYSLIALSRSGYGLDHPAMRRGVAGIEGFIVEDADDAHGVGAPAGRSRRLEACQSPVWDTALAMIALSDAGLPGTHPAMTRGAEWLLSQEVSVRGDWAVRRPALAPGGWAFEFANVNYPDTDDTAEVLLALAKAGHAGGATGGTADAVGGTGGAGGATGGTADAIGAATSVTSRIADAIGARTGVSSQAAITRAIVWLRGMQSGDGGWGAFDAENKRALVRKLPFLDFGEVIDDPSADVTAHAVETLSVLGGAQAPETRAGVRWLLEHQEADGSWFGRWGVNHVYGTGAVVPALVQAGVDPADESIRRAVRWLHEHQNDDGGWGEDPRSYDEPSWIGRGPSTASQTAWALLALHAAGEADEAMESGVRWLTATQRADGGWDEPQYTGTGFPSDYYINYHLYRIVFPVMALARCAALLEPPARTDAISGERAPDGLPGSGRVRRFVRRRARTPS